MIIPNTRFTLALVPIERIIVTEHQPRYAEQVLHYYRLLSDPAHRDAHAGLVHLAPYGVNSATGKQLFTLLDGHHRYLASILAGRAQVLALILVEPGWPEYETLDLPGIMPLDLKELAA